MAGERKKQTPQQRSETKPASKYFVGTNLRFDLKIQPLVRGKISPKTPAEKCRFSKNQQRKNEQNERKKQ